MKRFKRFFSLLTLIAVCLSLTACSNTTLSTDGFYWFEDATSFPDSFEEVLTYDVSVAHATPSNSTEIKAEGHTFDITKGEYVTKLQAVRNNNGNYYVYTTSFAFEGVYKTPEEEISFADGFTTETKFTSDLKPISSKKQYNSELYEYSYNYEISYSSDKADVTLVEYPNTDDETTSTFTIEDYTEGAYIDNDAILAFARLYNVSTSLYRSFKTIDVLSRKNQSMTLVSGSSGDQLDVKNLDNYVINGNTPTDAKVNCARVRFYISDTFSGSEIEAYYATDHKTHRHRLVETYTKLSGGLGYVKYSLKSATV